MTVDGESQLYFALTKVRIVERRKVDDVHGPKIPDHIGGFLVISNIEVLVGESNEFNLRRSCSNQIVTQLAACPKYNVLSVLHRRFNTPSRLFAGNVCLKCRLVWTSSAKYNYLGIRRSLYEP